MMKRLLSILVLLCPLMVGAASVNTYTVYPTNYAVSGDTITVNGVARTFTNATTATTILTNRTSLAGLMTNVFNAFGQYPMGASISFGSSTSLVFRGLNLTLATASGATNWAVVVTNLAPSTNYYAAMVPDYNMPGTNTDAVKINTANYLARYIDVHVTTNAFREAATVVSNLVGRTSAQDVGNKTITNSTLSGSAITNAQRIHGTVAFLTNGNYITPTLRNPVSTNSTNYGLAISSPGSGSGSEQFGSGATASGAGALAVGLSPIASGVDSISLGNNSTAAGVSDVSVGNGNELTGGRGAALGNNIVISSTNGTALGFGATVTNANSVAIGANATTTEDDQIRLGTSTLTVSVPGRLIAASSTNNTLTGTNTVKGDLSFDARVNTSLANGNNAGVLLGTNVYIRLMGPSASYVINGIAAERAGAYHILQLTNPAGTVTIANESGTDPTAANRILTGTGGDLVFTNNPVVLPFFYDGAASRWRPVWTR